MVVRKKGEGGIIVIEKSVLILMLLILPAGSLFSESVFLKNGEIVTGKIQDIPGKKSILIGKRKISRSQIIRINITDDHKNKRYFYTRKGTVIEGYVVKEDIDRYRYRLKLKSPVEKTILRKNIYFATLKKIFLEEGKKMPRVEPPVTSSRSHGVFLKNGQIIEGTILLDTKDTIKIKKRSGKILIYPRKKVQRTLYNDSYKYPFYLYKFNNFYDRAYIVGEDTKYYYLKDELNDKSEDDEKKSKYNFVSFSKIPLDTTKYEYPDLSFRTMYIPVKNTDGWEHNIVLGLEWADPLRPDIFPYWLHWTVGLLGNINIGEKTQGGAAYNTGFLFDIWRFVYARVEVGNMYSMGDGLDLSVFAITGAGVRFTFEDFFFLGIEAGAIFAVRAYPSKSAGEFEVLPSIYMTFGFNFF